MVMKRGGALERSYVHGINMEIRKVKGGQVILKKFYFILFFRFVCRLHWLCNIFVVVYKQ